MLYCCACGVRCEHCSLHLVQQVRCVRGFPITGHAHFWDLETRTAYIRTAAGCFTCVSGHLLLLASWWFVTLRGADYWDDSGPYNLCKHLTCRHTLQHLPSLSESSVPLTRREATFVVVVVGHNFFSRSSLSLPALAHTRTSTVAIPMPRYCA